MRLRRLGRRRRVAAYVGHCLRLRRRRWRQPGVRRRRGGAWRREQPPREAHLGGRRRERHAARALFGGLRARGREREVQPRNVLRRDAPRVRSGVVAARGGLEAEELLDVGREVEGRRVGGDEKDDRVGGGEEGVEARLVARADLLHQQLRVRLRLAPLRDVARHAHVALLARVHQDSLHPHPMAVGAAEAVIHRARGAVGRRLLQRLTAAAAAARAPPPPPPPPPCRGCS